MILLHWRNSLYGNIRYWRLQNSVSIIVAEVKYNMLVKTSTRREQWTLMGKRSQQSWGNCREKVIFDIWVGNCLSREEEEECFREGKCGEGIHWTNIYWAPTMDQVLFWLYGVYQWTNNRHAYRVYSLVGETNKMNN